MGNLLAAGRVYPFAASPTRTVSFYLRSWRFRAVLLSWLAKTLVSPVPPNLSMRGGFVSVALSLGFPPVAVSNCRILRCPDFPLVFKASGRLADYLYIVYINFLELRKTFLSYEHLKFYLPYHQPTD